MRAAVFAISLVVLFARDVAADVGIQVSHKFEVTVLTDGQREDTVNKFLEKNFEMNSEVAKLFNFRVEGVKDLTSLLPLLKRLSRPGFVKENSFIVSDLGVSSSLLASFLGKYVLFDIRNRLLNSDQNHLPNGYVMMRPSIEEQENGMNHFIQRMGFKKLEHLNCCFRHSMTPVSDQREKIARQLQLLEAKSPEVIFVKCPQTLATIWKLSNWMNLSCDSCKWIFPGFLEHGNISSFLPENVLVFSARHWYDFATSPKDDYLSYLQDSIFVIQKLVKEISRRGEDVSMGGMSTNVFRRLLKRLFSDGTFQGQTGNIQFNDNGCRRNAIYDIFEMVSFPGKRRWLHVGSWLNGKINTIFMQWTRNNSEFSRQVFRVVTYFGKPWVDLASVQNKRNGRCLIGHAGQNYTNRKTAMTTDTAGHEYCYTGFMIDFLLKLEELLNFEAHIHFVKDQKFGSINRSKSARWSGMIGELERGEADIAMHLLTITAQRLKVVSFSHPFMEASNGILVSSQSYSHGFWEFVFLATLSGELWFTLLTICLLVVIMMWFAERLRLRRKFLVKPHKSHRLFSLPEIISYVWSLTFQKAAEEIGPTSLAGRLLAGLFAFCAIIACSSFTANLAAIKVTERRGISISGIHDSKFQNPNKDFRFSVLSDSAGLGYFQGNTDPALKRMASYLERTTVQSFSEVSEKLENRQIHAFLGDTAVLKILAHQGNCDLKIVGNPFFFSGYGLAFPKDFTWRQQFSMAVLQLQDEDFFAQLIEKWIPQHCPNSDQLLGPKRLGLNEVGGSFLLLFLGSVAGALFLAVENWVWKSSWWSM